MTEYKDTILKSAIGVGAPLFAFAISLMDKVELVLKLASLAAGLVVAIVTAVSIMCKMRRDRIRFEHEQEEWNHNGNGSRQHRKTPKTKHYDEQ